MNKGIGAGGAKTNINGKSFENKTCIEDKLLKNNFIKKIINKNKYGYYYERINNNVKTIYLTQNGFKLYFKIKLNINVYKCPDEAYLTIANDIYYLKILEKKNQNVNGSIEDKLKTGLFNKKEYELMIEHSIKKNNFNYIFIISYAFCINKFLQNKLESNIIKYKIIKDIILNDNIGLFYGDDNTYFDDIYKWINKI